MVIQLALGNVSQALKLERKCHLLIRQLQLFYFIGNFYHTWQGLPLTDVTVQIILSSWQCLLDLEGNATCWSGSYNYFISLQLLSHLTGITINWPDCSNNFIWLATSLRLATVGLTVTIILFHLQHLSCLKGITTNWPDCSNNFIRLAMSLKLGRDYHLLIWRL